MSGWPGQKVSGGAPVAAPVQSAPQGGLPVRPVFSVPDPQQDIENQRNAGKDAQDAANIERQRLKDTWRTMTPQEQAAAGYPAGGLYQVNGLGEVKEVTAAPKTANPQSAALNLLQAAGVTAGKDPVSDLILGSTSGGLEKAGAEALGFFGQSTSGMQNIARLQTIVSDMVLALNNGSLGAGVSNADVDFIKQRVGNLADPSIPAETRLAAWQEVRDRLKRVGGVQDAAPPPGTGQGEAPQPDALDNPDLPLRGTVTDETPDPRVKQLADQWEQRYGPAGLSELATQGITLGLADEAGGIGSAAGRLLRGETDVAGNYQLYTAVERELVRRARERTGYAGTAAELLGGGGAIRTLGAGAMTVGRAALEGAGIGGVAGFGYGEGAQGSLAGAATGAAVGGALGAGIQRVANRGGGGGQGGAPAPVTPPTEGGQAIQAADNLNAATGSNIRLMPADVSGPGIRNITGGAAKMTLSGEIIGRRAEGLTREAEKAKDALVALAGGRAENEIAGEVALEGARKWMKSSATKRDALYAKARKLGGDQPVDLANARQVLDGHIAELSQTPGSAAGLERLKALRAELDQPFPVEGVKRMRTRLRDDFGSDGLRATDIERRVGQVIDAAEDDIVTSLQGAGKGDAARAYAEAAKAHRERVQVIDEVLTPIIGKKGSDPRSGEQIIRAIEQAAQSNSAKLGRFINTLPAEDAGVVRGTIIDRLGRASAGQQDAGGNAFSLNTFLTNWSKMSDRAKSSLFGGELRASLEDLAKVANARRESGRFVNFSNTGSTVGNIASGGALASSVANPAALSLFAVDGLTGALLSSARIARWLAKMPASPKAQRIHIQGLSKIAAADAAIAADALGLQQQLLARFGQGPTSLAAEGQGKTEGSNTTGPGTQ